MLHEIEHEGEIYILKIKKIVHNLNTFHLLLSSYRFGTHKSRNQKNKTKMKIFNQTFGLVLIVLFNLFVCPAVFARKFKKKFH
jgi:hypothetical protein